MKLKNTYRAVVIGVSSGGMSLIKKIVQALPPDFKLAVIIVQHIGSSSNNEWCQILDEQCDIAVKEADEKEKIVPSQVYIAPPNYHLLIETDETFTLTTDEKVNYARPSIDVTFETAAFVYGQELIGIVGTGANSDGALGLKEIQKNGGTTIVQNPKTAHAEFMPRFALNSLEPDLILNIKDIINYLLKVHQFQEQL